jgi:hypothetical protein
MYVRRHVARQHETGEMAKNAVFSQIYWDFQPGERVMTCDNIMGEVKAVQDGPLPGLETYDVVLDHGLGGGTYGPGDLSKPNQTTAALTTAGEVHLASEDYPEFGTILTDRPDPGKLEFTAAATTMDPEADDPQPSSCSYCGATEFENPTDNGRVRQATCANCGGTMSAHPGAQWTPELIGDPSNHPRGTVDPASGASGAGGQAGINDFIDFDSRVSTTAAKQSLEDGWNVHGDGGLSDDEYGHLSSYSGDGINEDLNRHLRGHPMEYTQTDDEEEMHKLSDVSHSMDQISQRFSTKGPSTVYRTAPVGHLSEGDEIHDPAHMSTTTIKGVTKGYSDPDHTLMHIHVPAGTHAIPMHHLLDYVGAPGEVIFPRGSRMRVNKVHDDHVEAEMLPHEGQQKQAARGLSWDEIGDRHPHVYGDADIHGEDADGADGPGIGDAANYIAHERPGHLDAEDSSVHDLEFHEKTVHPKHIDFSPSGADDYRVQQARQGYQEHPDKMPPLVLVHRHGVYQVADGHHRAEAAASLNHPVKAYVAHSPYPDEPFHDGEKGPFHGAVPEPKQRAPRPKKAEPVDRAQLSLFGAQKKTADLAGHDWCTWRREARCTFPGDSTAVSLAIPQDRGPCPWSTPWQQQVCPISEPGPMALMQAKGSIELPLRVASGMAKTPRKMLSCDSCKGKGYTEWTDTDPEGEGDPDEVKTFRSPCDDCDGKGAQEETTPEEDAAQEEKYRAARQKSHEDHHLKPHKNNALMRGCPPWCTYPNDGHMYDDVPLRRARGRLASQLKAALGPGSANTAPVHKIAVAHEEEPLDLYHRTTPEAASAIYHDKAMHAKDPDGSTYWSTSRGDENTSGYGSAVVHIRVPEHFAELDDEFSDGEQHYRVNKRDLAPHHFVED